MAVVTRGKLSIDPVKNPAVLDTGTWDVAAAMKTVQGLPAADLAAGLKAVEGAAVDRTVREVRAGANLTLYPGSFAVAGGNGWALGRLNDGQRVILEWGAKASGLLQHAEAASFSVEGVGAVRAYPTDAALLHSYSRRVDPEQGPRVLGPIPRMGIGVRHTELLWPGIWRAMHTSSFSANAIQNSVRELHTLDTLVAGAASRENHLFSFGRVEEGHTGSSFEGLWVSGVLSAMADTTLPRYGADADHIMVKRGADGLDRAKHYLDSAPYYTFYTLDVSDVLDYTVLAERSAAASVARLEAAIPDAAERRSVVSYHARKRWFFGQTIELDEAAIGRLVGKYWRALDAVQQLHDYIAAKKNGEKFDLELSIDETPAGVLTFEVLTRPYEMLFLMLEIRRRGLPVTHLAPNFGVEKGVDYRGLDGLSGLLTRVRYLHNLASEFGFMLDCHSGDDLTQPTRQVFGMATNGNIHFKVSPSLQVTYGHVLQEYHPDIFEYWWNDTFAWVKREAEAGSSYAIKCMHEWEVSDRRPGAHQAIFHHYNFATVGRRGADGKYLHREKLYDVSAECREGVAVAIDKQLRQVAEDVFDHGSL